ncbi:MAG: cytochrome c [Rhizobiaceae bacterium]|nr:cytochrome c [Rhizobiaceae bacterium]
MRRFLLSLSTLAIIAGVAHAGPVEDREALMKERGRLMGELGKMAKGEVAFDAAATLAALQTLQANAEKGLDVDGLWPAGSQGDTEASPKIWEDNAGFKAESEKYKSVVDAAVASAPADVAGLQAAMGSMGQECAACHQTYRVKK